MKWRNTRQSRNVEDRRGQKMASSGLPIAGLIRFVPLLMRSKIGRVILVLGAIYLTYQQLTGGGGALKPLGSSAIEQSVGPALANDETKQFVAAILGTTESVWQQLLPQQYTEPTLVLYSGTTSTGCGMGQAQTGPFYCPADEKIYIDLSFMQELEKLGAPGDFAFAYVVAHEVAHHIQHRLGISRKMRQLQQGASRAEANALSVRLELQADCFAGIWAHYVQQQMHLLEVGDIDEGLKAAASVGDDRLLEMAGRAVQTEAFTHGSSAQRMQWFQTGLDSGKLESCDTFSARP